MKLDELLDAPKLGGESMLVYGPPKSGKSELIGTLAQHFKLHWFDLENGVRSLLSSPRIKKEWLNNITYYPIPDTRKNPVAIATMMKVFSGNKIKICEKHGAVMCLHCMRDGSNQQEFCLFDLGKNEIVVVDSITQLNDSAYFQVVGEDIDADKEWKHYDAWNQRIAMCLSMIQQSPAHVVGIGHGKVIEQPDGTTKLCPVGGTNKFSPNIPRYFGHVLYTDVRTGKYMVGSRADFLANAIIGTRSNLRYGDPGITLREFFIPPADLPQQVSTNTSPATPLTLGSLKK